MMAASNDGLPSIADALELASAETEAATSVDVEDTQPVSEAEVEDQFEQAEASDTEHPEFEEANSEVDEEDDSIFGEIEIDEGEEEEPEQVPLEEQKFQLPGVDEPVSFAELRDGYLRQSDYTRKTQEIAEQRKQFEAQQAEATRLHKAVTENPVGLLSALAKQVGVDIDLKGVNPTDFQLPSRDDVEAEIERRVSERINNDPRVAKAIADEQVGLIEQEFIALEQAKGVTLSPKDREVLLAEAAKANGAPLNIVYDALMARVHEQRLERERLKKASTKKSQSRAPERDVTAQPKNIREAFERAVADIS